MASKNPTHCINPITGRRVTIGGRSWRRLVKAGEIDPNAYEKPNVLYTVDEDQYENPEDVRKEVYKQKKRLVAENTSRDMRPVVYKNKVINAQNKLTTKEASQRTADAAIEVIDDIQNNLEEIPTNMSRDEAHEYLTGLIFNKMLSQKKKFINKRLEPLSRRDSTEIVRQPRIKKPTTASKKGDGRKLKPLRRVKKVVHEPEPEYEYIEEEIPEEELSFQKAADEETALQFDRIETTVTQRDDNIEDEDEYEYVEEEELAG